MNSCRSNLLMESRHGCPRSRMGFLPRAAAMMKICGEVSSLQSCARLRRREVDRSSDARQEVRAVPGSSCQRVRREFFLVHYLCCDLVCYHNHFVVFIESLRVVINAFEKVAEHNAVRRGWFRIAISQACKINPPKHILHSSCSTYLERSQIHASGFSMTATEWGPLTLPSHHLVSMQLDIPGSSVESRGRASNLNERLRYTLPGFARGDCGSNEIEVVAVRLIDVGNEHS
ncbi:MAG: hypothetical protein JWQ19_2347 [Subtercola sp.]|nr:hypothetical protein [Subtercola sp.]